MTDEEVSKWAALFEAVVMIEKKADMKKIPEHQRLDLYRTNSIRQYINTRAPEIEMEITNSNLEAQRKVESLDDDVPDYKKILELE